MKKRFSMIFPLLAGFLFSVGFGAEEPPALTPSSNLVKNGDFEAGKYSPDQWEEVNDLTTFWVQREDGEGRCLRFDTDVYAWEYRARREEMKLPREKRPPAKPKTPPVGDKYDTVGGLDGAFLSSDDIEVEPGATYRLRAEVMSRGPEMKLFVKAYGEVKGERRVLWRTSQSYRQPDGKWRTIEHTFVPAQPGKNIRWVRIMPYAFWPCGEAFVDNVVLEKVEPP